MQQVAAGKATNGSAIPVRAEHARGAKRVDGVDVSPGPVVWREKRAKGCTCLHRGTATGSRAGEEQPHFPPVAAGMTRDANGLNQKNGRRRETRGQEKVYRCVPSTAP